MQNLTLPNGTNTMFGFYPVMRATVQRSRNGRVLNEMSVGIQSPTELVTFLRSSGYPITRAEAERDFANYTVRTYVLEV